MTTKEYLEQQETALIEDQAGSFEEKLLIRLLRRSGARVGEILSIEEDDINFTDKKIRIKKQKIFVSISCPYCKAHLAKTSAFCPKCGEEVTNIVEKKNKEVHLRILAMDDDTMALILKYIKAGGIKPIGHKRILFARTRQWAYEVVKRCAIQAGFNFLENPQNRKVHRVSPHKFRDAFAIAAIKRDDSMDGVRLLQERLGHTHYDTTMKYRKVSTAENKDWFERMTEGTR